jgi:hypothetical protein
MLWVPEGADLERLDRQLEVVDRRGRRGEVEHVVERLVDDERLADVVLDEAEPLVVALERGEVLRRPVRKLSTPITRWPSASRRSQRCEPRKPARR